MREGTPIGVIVDVAARRSGPFTDEADRAPRDVRRPGGDRDRERAAVQGAAGRGTRSSRKRWSSRRRPARSSVISELAHRHPAGVRRDPRERRRALCGAHDRLRDPVRRRTSCRSPPIRCDRGGCSTPSAPSSHAGSTASCSAARSSTGAYDSRTRVREDPRAAGASEQVSGGYRADAVVPMLREGRCHRRDLSFGDATVRPFTDKQIELLVDVRRPGGDRHRERAAVQGVQARNPSDRVAGAADGDRRDPAGDRSSPTDLQPVLEAVAENAARVCGATDSSIFRLEGEHLRAGGAAWIAAPSTGDRRYRSRHVATRSADGR